MEEYEIKLGITINELTILSYAIKPDTSKYESYGGPWVRCQCSCGKELIAPLYGIKHGLIKSCGHLKGQKGSETLKKYHEQNEPVNATYLTVNGETRNISEWSRISGIPRTTILYRLNRNMPLDQVFKKGEEDVTATNGD